MVEQHTVAIEVEVASYFARKVASAFQGQPFSREQLAKVLGYSNANSGAFNQRFADLRRLGVLTGRGPQLNLTTLAQCLVMGGYQSFAKTNEVDNMLHRRQAKPPARVQGRRKGVKPIGSTCPRCDKVAQGIDETEELFGFRILGGQRIPQSWCRQCRAKPGNQKAGK